MITALFYNLIAKLFHLNKEDQENYQAAFERYAKLDTSKFEKLQSTLKIRLYAFWTAFIVFILQFFLVRVHKYATVICAGLVVLAIITGIIFSIRASVLKKQLEALAETNEKEILHTKTESLWTYLLERGEDKIGLTIQQIQERIGADLDTDTVDEIMHTTKNGYHVQRANLALGFLEFVKED